MRRRLTKTWSDLDTHSTSRTTHRRIRRWASISATHTDRSTDGRGQRDRRSIPCPSRNTRAAERHAYAVAPASPDPSARRRDESEPASGAQKDHVSVARKSASVRTTYRPNASAPLVGAGGARLGDAQ